MNQNNFALGPTNLDAIILVPVRADGGRKKKSGRTAMFPVESEEIQSAVSSLNGIPLLEKKLSSPTKPPQRKASKIPHRRKTSLGNETPELLPLQRVLDVKADFYSKDELQQRHEEMSTRIAEKAKVKALRRISQFEQERRREEERRNQEEQQRAEEAKLLSAKKAEELQQRTALRVKKLKQEKYLKQREIQERERQELLARQEREALARAKDQVEKIRNLRRETEERF